MIPDLAAEVHDRFIIVNGKHPMTAPDDSYVNDHFVDLGQVCSGRAETPDSVRQSMLDRTLPLPSYLRSDQAEMVPPDYFRLADDAGGTGELPGWFQRHWTDPHQAAEEWNAYLDGQYVCLREVTPRTIQRKNDVCDSIKRELSAPQPGSGAWLRRMHALVDELDALTTQFTEYDRLRFDGPVSRDTLINDVRAKYPKPPEKETIPE